MIVNLLHNICSCHFHIGVWDGLGIGGVSGIGLQPDLALHDVGPLLYNI